MSSKPVVSVLMTVYNTGRFLSEAVESILSQTFSDFEFLIIDDGSTDQSAAILRTYADQDKRIRLWVQPNQGITASRNQLLDEARGEFIAVMDSDDVALPERFARQVEFLRAHPDYVVLGSQAEIIDPSGEPLGVWYKETDPDAVFRKLIEGQSEILCHPAVMMRRDAVLKAGKYNQNYQICVDLDLFLRMTHEGKIANLPESLLKYRMHLKSVSHRKPSDQMQAALNMIMDARKRHGISDGPVKVDVPAEKPAPWMVYNRWGWWALSYQNIKTARKYAVRSLMGGPFALESWKLLYCSMRGH